MTYEQLNALQGLAGLILLVCLGAGAIYLVVGLIRPSWVGRKARGGVVAIGVAAWLLGFAILAGTIVFTHSQPNGPHSVTGYIDSYVAEECAKGVDLPGCKPAADAGASAAKPVATAP